ncbi:hypothetical protein GALMADRAFT_143401 [Galerina marginata CBS 339.88]|uniref:HMG domain-containing protein n=1 Tax=Galerina marginata (strain CBS 339.88) TaxID=685588 RepID=A0A067SPV0_GALM3|nr:hypothetical protein GALMADRAFT_143401 [Galerina marginata CBS 339.88]
MNDSPLSIITYAPLPESPTEIHYQYQDTVTQIITPQRKPRRGGNNPRVNKWKRGSKVQQEDAEEPAQLGWDEVEGSAMNDGLGIDNIGMPDYEQSSDLFSSDFEQAAGQLVIEGGQFEETGAGVEGDQPPAGEAFSTFVEATLVGECGMYQLTDRLFVVNGWNRKKRESTGTWYHLQRTRHHSDGGWEATCLCPGSRNQTAVCFHARFIQEEILYRGNILSDDDKRAFLFSRSEDLLEESYLNYFSVPSHTRFHSIKNRAIVEHRGDDTGLGMWKCITANAEAGNIQFGGMAVSDTEGISESVSYTPLPLPIWARISSDPPAPPRFTFSEPPQFLGLNEGGTCCCFTPRATFNPLGPTFLRKCVVYTLTGAHEATIEVQKCTACSHRLIGPDCHSLGLFNLNNWTILAHDLLDDYTSEFSASETPFVAWVLVVSRCYQTRQSKIPFMNHKLFRQAWFSYMRLMQFGTDMCCAYCGPTPDITIWDGVTVAFSRRNLLPTLHPPTTIGESSVIREDVRPLSLLSPAGAVMDSTHPNFERDRGLVLRISKIPELVAKLKEVDMSLGKTFEKHFGLDAVLRKINTPEVYSKFFTELAANENALQFIPYPTLQNLRTFVRHPSHSTASSLRYIPVLRSLLLHEYRRGELDGDILGLCTWLYVRSLAVYESLKTHEGPGREASEQEKALDDWTKTGAYYGMPQIRERPSYPGIPYENASDQGGKDSIEPDVCHKYYSEYSKKRLTGGLMCVWCSHSVCYGFHCIPAAEGRNDVFSAIYTRWEKAPRVIIYDFACALQPYCMSREAEFFRDTLFLIDHFHSEEHKCSQACFLAPYCNENPELGRANSSAAECGNSGLKKIRKSIGFMRQDRATMQIQKMEVIESEST